MTYLIFLFLLISSVGCSVYRSEGRRQFENDVPTRVPISVFFHCPNLSSPSEPARIVSWEMLKITPGLTVYESIHNQTVVLLASSNEPHTYCFSEGLDLAEYLKNRPF
ncbi:MAG: hypothetical protein JNL11_01565 [Bdellovibrionaceae bacterium]|nr:hypothetical protein [Pseudobdellovibrionaceae bacterium]